MSKPPSLASYLVSAVAALGWLTAAVALFLLPAIMAALGRPSAWWLLVTAFGLIALGGAYTLRRVDPVYELGDFGPTDRVDVRTFDDDRETCTRCETSTRRGLYRRYRRQWVVAGVPIYTMAWGRNAYCPDCIDPDTLAPIDDPRTEEATETTASDPIAVDELLTDETEHPTEQSLPEE